MNNNEQLLIKQVDNGFLVTSGYKEPMYAAADSMMVFQSMAELVNFLEDHFDHRCVRISADEATIIREKHESPL